jgi:hypothetical protein
MSEDDVVAFIAGSISSVWALELLFLLKRIAPNGRPVDALIQELRSSTTAVSEGLRKLHDAGLIVEEDGAYYYRPAATTLDRLATEAERLYALKPSAVIKTIVTSKHQSLKDFADSFKFKE